ncbi:DNA/RNA helicase domain-containing protein [Microbulbifer sp. TYP-18]|uniref:DNA/RNA helicase domain-containing protein n=1 Tax=Microbulbifer sp. TYP-18 TaxID=3230024 RepID=UPI0034C6C865
MLVYSGSKKKFIEDVKGNAIENVILSEFERKLFKRPSQNEVLSWKNSMQYMFKIMIDPGIPQDSGISIEYVLPLTSKRVDFILTGKDEDNRETAIIIELKQWSKVKKIEKDGIVKTFLAGGERETSHPSYQVWTYAALIEDYNETVRQEGIRLIPCAYLHNLISSSAINDPFYAKHIGKAPVFISSDAEKFAKFLKKYIKYGDNDNIMYRIEHGRIKPSKGLIDSLQSMLTGNQEFLMIDDQKLVYEAAIDLAYKAQKGKKQVLIVEGGPGTGKSVVAVNLLVELTKREMNVQYVSKNAAPRDVFSAKLAGTLTKTKINNMFKGSGSYISSEQNLFDALIVDEAHRLNEKSGLYSNQGENQIKEIISASKFSIFFLDENQRVTLKDIGSIAEIEGWSEKVGATIHRMDLKSQFRCNGSEGYLAWVDSALQIRDTANTELDNIDYDFKVFDSPISLREEIFKKNIINNKARLVAGYCWKWESKKDRQAMDIHIPKYGFEAQWNLSTDGGLWIISPESVREIGCIHTCQGLEVDYIGVIIGPDFVVRNGKVVTDPSKRDGRDKTIRDYKKLLEENSNEAARITSAIIKNTYRTLMTRGIKGCYLFCTDPETNEYFSRLIDRARIIREVTLEEKYPGLNLRILSSQASKPCKNFVPIYNLKIAAGDFSEYQTAGEFDWVEMPEHIRITDGYFVAQVLGESMNRHIPNGSWCLFRANPAGSREGKIVLVQHRDIQDVEQGGHYTVKEYHSDKVGSEDEGWRHSRIILRPKTNALGYKDIPLTEEQIGDLRVVGEYVSILS